MVQPKLSILIPSLHSRAGMLASLLRSIENQVQENNAKELVEILVEMDGGAMSTGAKRNVLLQKATGDFTVFVDDDDSISNDYLKLILKGIETNPDTISLNGIITFDSCGGRLFKHSIRYGSYYENDGIYYRHTNHLNPIRRSISQQFVFPELNHSEDTLWSRQVYSSGLLKTEYEIPSIIYFYNFITNK